MTMPAEAAPVLEVENLTKHFPIRRGVLSRVVGQVRALDGVSFAIRQGETLGLVGESGCGKSTAGKTILKLLTPTAGRILLEGEDITALGRRAMRPYRRRMQIVFQDPYASLNPRARVGAIIAAPFAVHGLTDRAERRDRVRDLMRRVGLDPDQAARYPHEFSGGQRQRIGIARALALNPSLIVCDEPVSALDVSVQAQVVNLMADLQRQLGLSYLFISHDLGVIAHISHRVAVMYLGQIVEMADKRTLFANPRHPYTEALLAAAPEPDPGARGRRRAIIKGEVPSAANPPPGCRFHLRCPLAEARCRTEPPPLRRSDDGRLLACHLR